VTIHDSSSVCINTVDSDIGLYALYFSTKIDAALYVKMGVKDRTRIIDINEIKYEIGEELCIALPALHTFTGNDYPSAISWYRQDQGVQPGKE
jgi:hypothetical protein